MAVKYRMVKERVFWWPVTVHVPAEEPERAGKTDEWSFDMLFVARPAEEIDAIVPREGASRLEKDNAMLFEVCRDWRGVEGADEKPVAFSHPALLAMISFAWARTGIYRAYAQAIAGGEARTKN